LIAITATNLTKRFGEQTAVDNLNLSIEEGELFALLGVNGAGKTTTIKMLSCLIKPTSGDAILLNESILGNTELIKQKTNISPQETAVARNLTVRENLEFIAGIYGQDGKAAKQSAKAMAERFGLTNIMGKKTKILSGGMQRRLSIAMALISQPQILFLDEPTLGLDVLARRELWASIKALKGEVTIILTTHYMEEVEALADRIGVMSSGKLLAVGTLAELTAQTGTNKLEDAFVELTGGGAL
jgi:ABC-2 type transport system ATP-binding protein